MRTSLLVLAVMTAAPRAAAAEAVTVCLQPLGKHDKKLLAPIQRILPPVGGFDLSPLVLLLAVYVLQMVVARV